MDVSGKTVALTGAASGIGRALALELASRGCALALSDNNTEGLRETQDLVKAASPDCVISLHSVDVADLDQVNSWAESAVTHHSHIDILINNAGVAASGAIDDITVEEFNWVFNILFYGVLYGTKAFLPHLKTRPQAHIVNISSVNGFFPFPGNASYACGKHAVKAFSQTLMQELDGSSINVSSVHPGGIKTNIVNSSRYFGHQFSDSFRRQAGEEFTRLAKTTPEKAAKVIVAGIEKNKKRVLVGVDAYILDMLNRIFPQAFSNFIGRWVIKHRSALEEQSAKTS